MGMQVRSPFGLGRIRGIDYDGDGPGRVPTRVLVERFRDEDERWYPVDKVSEWPPAAHDAADRPTTAPDAEARAVLTKALDLNSYRGRWHTDRQGMQPMAWDADDAVVRVIEHLAAAGWSLVPSAARAEHAPVGLVEALAWAVATIDMQDDYHSYCTAQHEDRWDCSCGADDHMDTLRAHLAARPASPAVEGEG